jgi:hypothetical protein
MLMTRRLRELLWERLRAEFGERVSLNGHVHERLPNTLNVSFAGQVGAEILARMPEVVASTGSACHSGRTERCWCSWGCRRSSRPWGSPRMSAGAPSASAWDVARRRRRSRKSLID